MRLLSLSSLLAITAALTLSAASLLAADGVAPITISIIGKLTVTKDSRGRVASASITDEKGKAYNIKPVIAVDSESNAKKCGVSQADLERLGRYDNQVVRMFATVLNGTIVDIRTVGAPTASGISKKL